MSSQGDAGQFRTPRHIIEFIVDVLNPSKDDKILDPACGTGGFLVSAYKHILKQHDGKDDPEGKEKPLTPDQKRKMMQNFEGYDIDPTMARIAQVNMYLHQFKNPKIIQYDSLSQDEFWHDKFDVILANPPFMSPKGGIKPHSKFSIQSNRSEVLFVDYIINHLKPNGRSGIIVPEGIIFQSGIAYKTLRKNLINDGLYAVISLPSGVFQPYSGVKTSILLIDKEFAKKSNEILFIKIENDGFDLGAQRRVNVKNDLPQALQILQKFKNHFLLESPLALTATDLNNSPLEGPSSLSATDLNNSPLESVSNVRCNHPPLESASNVRCNHPPVESVTNVRCNHPPLEGGSKLQSNFGEGSKNFLLVPKSKIAENGDYNLSGDRYRVATDYSKAKWEMVELGEVCETSSGGTPLKSKEEYYENGSIPWLRSGEVSQGSITKSEMFITELGLKNSSAKIFPINTVLVAMYGATAGQVGILKFKSSTNQAICGILPNEKLIPEFLFWVLKSQREVMTLQAGGGAQPNISQNIIQKLKIPLPPLEIQEQIVSELDGYSSIIAGAKQIVANWKPKIDTDPSWEMVELEKIITTITPPAKIPKEFFGEKGIFPIIDQSQEDISGWTDDEECVVKFAKPVVIFGDHTCVIKYSDTPFAQGADGIKILATNGQLIPKFLYFALLSNPLSPDGYQRHFSKLKRHKIPLPPLETQQQIVSQIEVERTLVESAKKLIEIYEQKTKAVIKKLWEE